MIFSLVRYSWGLPPLFAELPPQAKNFFRGLLNTVQYRQANGEAEKKKKKEKRKTG